MNIDISTVHAARISLSRVLDVSVNTIVSKNLYLESQTLTLFRQQTHREIDSDQFSLFNHKLWL